MDFERRVTPIHTAGTDDEDRFAGFYQAHVAMCRRTLRKRFPAPPPDVMGRALFDELVDDAIDEAFMIVHADPERFDPRQSSISTWLVAIAKKRLHRKLQMSLQEARWRAGPDELQAAAAREPELSVEVVMRQSLEATLGRMNERQAEVIRLHYLQGWPVRKIAEALGLTPGAAQSLLQRARESLRRLWEESNEEG